MVRTESIQTAMEIFAHYASLPYREAQHSSFGDNDPAMVFSRDWLVCQVRGQDGWFVVSLENPTETPLWFPGILLGDLQRVIG